MLTLLTTLVLALSLGGGAAWNEFTKDDSLELDVAGSDTYYVLVPCPFSWFKLFLKDEDGSSIGHIELFSQTSGNMFCKNGGTRNWYNGDRTDFSMAGMVCGDDIDFVTLKIVKDSEHVAIYNNGNELYSQSFGSNDGDCVVETATIKTQVWTDEDNLFLGLPVDVTALPERHLFTKEESVDMAVSFEGSEVYYVLVPCPFSWFKIFLKDADGSSTGHIELYSQTSGNIYCKNGGTRNWYSGDKTDFSMAGNFVCETEDASNLLKIVKDPEHVAIYLGDSELYSQSFGSNDGDCVVSTGQIKTQVWTTGDDLYLSFPAIPVFEMPRIPVGALPRYAFTKEESINMPVAFDGSETYYVQVPCPFVWFKLFLKNADGDSTGHIELFSQTSGNIYCKNGGTRNWYSGDKTDFSMAGNFVCETEDASNLLKIVKDPEHVAIYLGDSELYSQSFGSNDGDCVVSTGNVVTQVWTSGETLYLSFPLNP